MDRNEAKAHIADLCERVAELDEILDSSAHDSKLAFLEACLDVQDMLGRLMQGVIGPALQGKEIDDEPALLLQIYQASSGQWAGRLLSGTEEIGGCAACESPEAVAEAARESGIIPDRVEILEG
ncbi:hypothetical protein PZF67_006720 [Pseudomonas aeruginosa]|uniref:hypothetical protein n=1 Tax=Pseudomonas TaxID=286 RepID=UPI0007075821|nr:MULTISPECIES: hypothetical protein [Pseudomonas]EKW9641654.1 hypothetical protein [Pseudomonas aeruginosa]KQJ49936.1 hypothetical protein AN280_30880 [Pseudomonas aeruginosa]SUF22544.1 Uncharacterised protein [Pseudomonas putida]HBO7046400.1 hypothetical protein [Pseudomonas aeruginosa]HBP6380082.1 hypothetical protein [Pseudomonas aeruginosa]